MGVKRHLELVPVTLREARAFVNRHHRHHVFNQKGHKFAIGIALGSELVGVAIVGRPIARGLQDGFTAEVLRTCVLDGIRNGNSKLYGACWRAARPMGYRRLVTYNRQDETGVSLVAAGWRIVGQTKARSWEEEYYQPREEHTEPYPRTRWEMTT